MTDELTKAQARIAELEALLAVAVEALRFYEHPSNYERFPAYKGGPPALPRIMDDRGAKARITIIKDIPQALTSLPADDWLPIENMPSDMQEPGKLVVLWVNWSDEPGWTMAKWDEDYKDGRTGWWKPGFTEGGWWLIPDDIITHWRPYVDFAPPRAPERR